jgi:hypothetical protein
MGLDCSHDAFHGAYSAFNRLRQAVCRAMGGSFPPHEDKTLDLAFWYLGDGYGPDTHPGLLEFLSHSDCDGEIAPEMCVRVADELEALLPKVSDDGAWGHLARDGGYVAVLEQFIAGCRDAAAAGEPLRFF